MLNIQQVPNLARCNAFAHEVSRTDSALIQTSNVRPVERWVQVSDRVGPVRSLFLNVGTPRALGVHEANRLVRRQMQIRSDSWREGRTRQCVPFRIGARVEGHP